MTQEEIWDDSALINSWNEALEEYQVGSNLSIDPMLGTAPRANIEPQLYHSIAARGEDVQEVLKKADGYESETDEDSESKAYNGNGGSTDNIEEGEIDDESPSQKNKDLSENSTSPMEVCVQGSFSLSPNVARKPSITNTA